MKIVIILINTWAQRLIDLSTFTVSQEISGKLSFFHVILVCVGTALNFGKLALLSKYHKKTTTIFTI